MMLKEGNIFTGVCPREGVEGIGISVLMSFEAVERVDMAGEVGWICRRRIPSIHGTSGGRAGCPSTPPPNIGYILLECFLVSNDAKMVQSTVF